MEAIGQPLDRVDGRLKVTGTAPYAAEFQLPNLTYAALIQAPIGLGQITLFDDSQARAQLGVLDVISYLNAPKLSNPLFGGPEISYSGQHLGVVIADTLERARHAVTLIRIECQAQKPQASLNGHEAEAVDPQRGGRGGRGDIAAGRASAAQTISATYSTPTEHHNPMEPHATIATWTGESLTVYDATQGVYAVRNNLARTFGISPENVRVICPFVGGGFGGKGSMWLHVPIAAMAAKAVGRPVKLVLRRQEMFSNVGYRSHTQQSMEMGATAEGAFTHIRHDTINETSARSEWVEGTGRMTSMMYACPNVETTNKLVRVTKMAPTFMRGPGEAVGSIGLECALDELAEKLGLDPVDFRLKNETDTDGSNKKAFSSRALAQCLTIGREKFGWSQRQMQPATHRQGRYLIGYGVAAATYPANFRNSNVSMSLTQNGAVLVQTASHDLGTGAYTIFTQIAAEALGVPTNAVRVELGDSKLPEGVLAGGSVTSASTGSAILDAGAKLKARLIELAISTPTSPLGGLPADQITAADGRLFATASPTKTLSYTDAVKLSGQPRVEVNGDNGRAQRPDLSYYSFGAQFSKVRVDLELGLTRVEKVLGVYGAGRILNSKTARSQMHGGILWGLGMALTEETLYDPNTARPVTRNLADYHIPSCADSPEIEVIWVPETDTRMSPIGAKGIGEIGIVGVAASIANAVYNATGKRVRNLPITPDKLV
jgi:xanthine dehydrogenase YagR molybdenum-binding subunit